MKRAMTAGGRLRMTPLENVVVELPRHRPPPQPNEKPGHRDANHDAAGYIFPNRQLPDAECLGADDDQAGSPRMDPASMDKQRNPLGAKEGSPRTPRTSMSARSKATGLDDPRRDRLPAHEDLKRKNCEDHAAD
jgi:hypothetical protein